MKLINQNIIIVSNEKWGNMWYSKHNYANQLSKKNNVFFLNPPHPFHMFNLFKKKITSFRVSDSLTVLEYKNILPTSLPFLWKINDFIIIRAINIFFKKNKINNIIFWTFDPIRLSLPELLNPKKIIFHAVDKYQFKYPSEEILSKKSDLILCVSDTISSQYKSYNKNIYTIPHGVPDDEFLPVELVKNDRITGLFIGNNDSRIDFEFTKKIIEAFPSIIFKFVGRVNVDNEESLNIFSGKYPNVLFIGEIPYPQLKYQIRESNFCFIFKKENYPGNNISSHKMLVYLSQGKPIVSTIFSEFQTERDLLFMSNDLNNTIENINNIVSNEEEMYLIQKRIEFAKKHSYKNILINIEKLL